MFIKEWFQNQTIKAEEQRCAEQEDAWYTSEAGPIGLYIGKGRRELGLTGEDPNKKDETPALKHMAKKHILEGEMLNEERAVLLQDIFTSGVIAITSNKGLGEISQRHGISRDNCFEILKEAFELVRDGYRKELHASFEKIISQQS